MLDSILLIFVLTYLLLISVTWIITTPPTNRDIINL